jgi:hypothetical protein
MQFPAASYEGPVDLDELFTSSKNLAEVAAREDDNDTLFRDTDTSYSEFDEEEDGKDLLDNDASLIPGSPTNKAANRRAEPLSIAKYASTFTFFVTIGCVVFLVMAAVWDYNSIGRIVIEVVLAVTLLSLPFSSVSFQPKPSKQTPSTRVSSPKQNHRKRTG